MPRPRGLTSIAKNQMQLAIALSSSLEESKTLELSKQAEALPASAIEYGAVPQNIKQMQKEFLERLQPPTRAGPTKRSKKVANLAVVPTLLSRSAEERLRIITEKVALILIQEDAADWNLPTVTTEDNKENVLWNKSSSLPFPADRNSFYTAALALFIPPSDVEVGSKLSVDPAKLPGLLKTPVAHRPNLDASSLSQAQTQNASGAVAWSHLHQFSPKSIDQDRDAQTELANDWGRMLNNSTLSDVTILVKGGKKLPAHKLVLFARCPEILNDLDAKNLLSWNTVTQSQALAFLEFIYSGKLAGTRNLRPNVHGVALLARKYNVTELLKLILTFDSNNTHDSSGCDFMDNLEWNQPDELEGNLSEDVFVNMKESDAENMADNSSNVGSHNEDSELLKDFFGTYNPALASASQTCSAYTPMHNSYISSSHNTVFSSQENDKCDTFSSELSSQPKTKSISEIKSTLVVTSSPEECCTDDVTLKRIQVSSQNLSSENVSSCLLRGLDDTPKNKDRIEISSDDDTSPVVKSGVSPYKHVDELSERAVVSRTSFENKKLMPLTEIPKLDSTLSQTLSKRKLIYDNSEAENRSPKKVCKSQTDTKTIFGIKSKFVVSSSPEECCTDEAPLKRMEICSLKLSPENVSSSVRRGLNDTPINKRCIEISSDDDTTPVAKSSVCELNERAILSRTSFENKKLMCSTEIPTLESALSQTVLKRKLMYDNSKEENQPTKKACPDEFINICSSDDSRGSCQITSSPNVAITPSSTEKLFQGSFNFNNSLEYIDEIQPHDQIFSPNESLNSTMIVNIASPKYPEDKFSQNILCNLNNSIEPCDPMEKHEPMSSHNESLDSTLRADFSTPDAPDGKSKRTIDDSLNINTSADNYFNEIDLHEPSTSLNKSDDATIIFNHSFSTPKLPRKSVSLERKMLDDSFMFDVNDSYLIREAGMKEAIPLEDKTTTPLAASSVLLRTPLEDVKTTSPVTPLPDFNAMSNQQYQTELLKYGLKRNMTKNRGIKMLKYIYGQMHPLVEVVNVKGKQLFIPLGEKTPASTSASVPCATAAPAPASPESCHDDSCSSDEELAPVLEETIFDRDEQLSQEVLGVSDLKTAVKTWIFNQPALYERILRYEPIWLESIHMELKEYLNGNIKLNNLMDVLDEEGITFRLDQGARYVARKRASPKKKTTPTKRKASPKKQAKGRKKNA